MNNKICKVKQSFKRNASLKDIIHRGNVIKVKKEYNNIIFKHIKLNIKQKRYETCRRISALNVSIVAVRSKIKTITFSKHNINLHDLRPYKTYLKNGSHYYILVNLS